MCDGASRANLFATSAEYNTFVWVYPVLFLAVFFFKLARAQTNTAFRARISSPPLN
jgi:hypothetical protein